MTIQHLPASQYYYDTHPTKEDLMGEGPLQDLLLRYLVQVLNWLYREEDWYVARNLNLYYTNDEKEPPMAPDIAVFKGTTTKEWLETGRRSWRIDPPWSPPPDVVFEVASDETWGADVRAKPRKYAARGIAEYVYYDPRPSRRPRHKPLRGWRNNAGVPEEMKLNERGWLWSEELESWLVPDGPMLRLYDRIEQQRPTEAEAERMAKEEERAAKEEEQAAKERAWTAEERARVAEERARAAEERARAAEEEERAAKERAWAFLRSLGIDPESIQ